MEMPLLKVKEYNEYGQLEKIEEEFEEFMSAEDGTYEVIAEALDLITATFTMLTHEYTKEELKNAIENHCTKLKSRGWETKGTIKIELEDEE